MADARNILAELDKLPTLIVAGTRFLAKELADGHGLEQGEWIHVDSVGRMKGIKAEEVMFGRGADKVPEIREIIEASKKLGHKVVFGDYPKLGEAPLPPPVAAPAAPAETPAPPAPPAASSAPTETPPAPPASPAPPTEEAKRDMRRRENRQARTPAVGTDEIKDVLYEIAAVENKYEALLRKLIAVAERKLTVLQGARERTEVG